MARSPAARDGWRADGDGGGRPMSGRSLDRLLSGTALARALVLAGPAMGAPNETSAAIEALVPVPEPANVPPPTIADIGGQATATITPKTDEVEPAPAGAPAPA